jgi:type I restriction-modification system DNA methylase subunit
MRSRTTLKASRSSPGSGTPPAASAGRQEAPKVKDFILPLIFTKRLCDVFDDELNRIAEQVGSRVRAFKLVEKDHKLVRFYLPLKPQDPDDSVWSVIRKLTGKIGESLTTYLHDIAKANPSLEGIIDRMDSSHPRSVCRCCESFGISEASVGSIRCAGV